MLRLTGGEFRGRFIETLAGTKTRPTQARLRQALFNSLQAAIPGARVLDLFAGSGALGFEALSRGVAEATFMDINSAALDCARANGKALGVSANFILADARNAPRARKPATLLFLDPPYGGALGGPALAGLREAGWIAPGAIVSLEMSGPELSRFAAPDGFEAIDERRYGKARIVLLRHMA